MRRPPFYEGVEWDDPRWYACRLIVDLMGPRYRLLADDEIHPYLASTGAQSAFGLLRYLEVRPELVPQISDHLRLRWELEEVVTEHLRTEEEAVADGAELTDEEVRRYGTRSAGHHQSAQAMVATVEVLTRLHCAEVGTTANTDPRERVVVIDDRYLWTSPRRLDGAIPDLVNPWGIWEIKEYWGTTGGGSKMSDAIYELHLVGLELRALEREHGVHVGHFAILDGRDQWAARRADLRRAIDLLCMGLLDELVVGREVLHEWPRILAELTP